jgi:hypothetical protein
MKMAVFTEVYAFQWVSFSGPGSVDFFQNAGATTSSYTDGDAASTSFQLDEQWFLDSNQDGVIDDPSSAPLVFKGTATVAGQTIYIFEDGGFGGSGNYSGVAVAPSTAADFAGIDEAAFTTALQNTFSATNDVPICFAAGTLIATPEGESTVEALSIGDLILAADGRTVPVKWIGRQTLHKLFAGERARPVRVTAGALGNGLPHTDLVLTADHALIFDGLAINAGALVNGTTITLEPLAALPDRVTYYHVETEAHDVILANGTPAETFIDYVGRQAFDNHAEYVELYGDARIIPEMSLPRISTARLVPPAQGAAGEALPASACPCAIRAGAGHLLETPRRAGRSRSARRPRSPG